MCDGAARRKVAGVDVVDAGEGRTTARWRAWLTLEVRRLAAVAARLPGLLVLLASSYWTAVGSAHLGTVLATQSGASATLAPSTSWAAMVALTAGGFLMVTRPSRSIQPVELGALVGACWTLGWTALMSWFFYSVQFMDPDSRCQYPFCWPGAYQALAVAAPLATACLLVIAMATAGRRFRWRVRALVPAGIYVVLTLVQVGIWERFVLPLFNGPPPW
jgi:hypothetical protein